MSDSVFSEIKRRVSCREILESAGINVSRGGKVKCPIHGEKTASLKVYDDPARGWHCFGCGAGGSVIDLAMQMYGVDVKTAAMMLNDSFGLGLEFGQKISREEALAMQEDRRKREEQSRAEKAAALDAENRYLDALDAWIENERIIEEKMPTGTNEPCEEYAEAVMIREQLRYELECAEQDRCSVESRIRQRRRSAAHGTGAHIQGCGRAVKGLCRTK